MSRIVAYAAVALLLSSGFARPADATTIPVFFNQLNASATVLTPFHGGDTLFVDTVVTTETGAMMQTVTFTLGPDVAAFSGNAAWEVTTATGVGPRLVGVNIDIFDSGNVIVASDAFAGVLGGFAVSTFDSLIGPGTYRMVATGTAVRATSLDISLSFAAVPEPGTSALLLGGLGLLRVVTRRGGHS